MSILAGAISLMLAAAPAEGLGDPPGFRAWGAFGLNAWRARGELTVRILAPEGRGPARWLAEKYERRPGESPSRFWADSRQCPALAELPASLAEIDSVTIGREIPLVEETPSGFLLRMPGVDGPSYVIDAPAAFQGDWSGRVRLDSPEGPVKVWVERALVALAPCWSEQVPRP